MFDVVPRAQASNLTPQWKVIIFFLSLRKSGYFYQSFIALQIFIIVYFLYKEPLRSILHIIRYSFTSIEIQIPKHSGN